MQVRQIFLVNHHQTIEISHFSQHSGVNQSFYAALTASSLLVHKVVLVLNFPVTQENEGSEETLSPNTAGGATRGEQADPGWLQEAL